MPPCCRYVWVGRRWQLQCAHLWGNVAAVAPQRLLRRIGGGAKAVPQHCHWVLPLVHGFFNQQSALTHTHSTPLSCLQPSTQTLHCAFCSLFVSRQRSIFMASNKLTLCCSHADLDTLLARGTCDGASTQMATWPTRSVETPVCTELPRPTVSYSCYVVLQVETEVVVTRQPAMSFGELQVSSLVQVRGSIPVVWSHTNMSNLKPDIDGNS